MIPQLPPRSSGRVDGARGAHFGAHDLVVGRDWLRSADLYCCRSGVSLFLIHRLNHPEEGTGTIYLSALRVTDGGHGQAVGSGEALTWQIDPSA